MSARCGVCGLVVSARGMHTHMRRAHSDASPPNVQHRYVHSEKRRRLRRDAERVTMTWVYAVRCSCGWLSRFVLRSEYAAAERSWHQHALSALVQQQRDERGRFVGAAS